MRCPACQQPARDGARHCAQCGARLAPSCIACGGAVEADDRHCTSCGARLEAPVVTPGWSDGAEHRQLTVAFCDLVGSTALASQLGPEDWREVVRAFQHLCRDAIGRFEGHVAQYLGDGLLVYFGYPRAHEDDAERAVRAALETMAGLEALNPRLESEYGARLAARIGIHTGPVVVGEMGLEGRQEMIAVGATANVAARLQASAEPGTIRVSRDTLSLVLGIFVTEDLGPQRLKGVAHPVPVHRVLRASGVRSRLALSRDRLSPLVGREEELGALLECWWRARAGRGQSVLVSGPPGIGKSRLVLALRERLGGDAHTWLECQGSPYTQASPFRPMIGLLEAGLSFSERDAAEDKRTRLERGLARAGLDPALALPPLASLLGLPLPEGAEAGDTEAGPVREQVIEALAHWALFLADEQPVVLVVEDLHWFDPSSLALLRRIVERIADHRVLVLLTARAGPELGALEAAATAHLRVENLPRAQARALAAHCAGRDALAPEAIERVVERADGVPLFLEELVYAALEAEADGRTLGIPATLQDSLTARLDRLGGEKELAQLAAVIGRELPHVLLEAASGLAPGALASALERLVEGELLLRHGEAPDARYAFRHALLQEATYASLLRSRRRALHERVARALERCFPERAAAEPETVARHLAEAGLPAEALPYYLRAGERDSARSANTEAIAHLSRGLELVPMLPEAQRAAAERALRVALGPSLIASRGPGDGEVGRNYERARALCPDGAAELLHVLAGLYTFHLNQGEIRAAFGVAQEQAAMAQRAGEPAQQVRARWSLGQTLCLRGDALEAVRELELGLALYEPERDRALGQDRSDQGVSLRSWLSWACWLAGEPARALRWGEEAVALARLGAHPYSLAYALGFDAVLHYMRHDRARGGERAREAVALSRERAFPVYLVIGSIVSLWAGATVEPADPEAAASAERFRAAFGSLSGRGAHFGKPLACAALAEILLASGRAHEARETLAAGLAFGAETGIRFWQPELLRLEAEALAQAGSDPAAAESLLAEAIATARKQRARGLELRAATSLAGLLQRRGNGGRARRVLAPLLARHEGEPDAPDLRDATALLSSLGPD